MVDSSTLFYFIIIYITQLADYNDTGQIFFHLLWRKGHSDYQTNYKSHS